MRDANRGAADHQFLQGGLHGAFRFGVERTGGFVQHENRRVLLNGPGDGDALALAAGQHHAFSPTIVS